MGAASSAEMRQKLVGEYEYRGPGEKNDYHKVTITSVDETTFKWTNRANVSWTLKLMEFGDKDDEYFARILKVQPDSPYYSEEKDAARYAQHCEVYWSEEDAGSKPKPGAPPRDPNLPDKPFGLGGPGGVYERVGDPANSMTLPIADALVVWAAFDPDLQRLLEDFMTKMSTAIRNKYRLGVALSALSEALRKKQEEINEGHETADSVAIAGDVIAFVGLMLMPFTGGASEAIAVSLEIGIDVATAVAAGGQLFAAMSVEKSETAAREYLDYAQKDAKASNEELDRVEVAWKTFTDCLEKRHTIMVDKLKEVEGVSSFPTLEQFEALAVYARSVLADIPDFGKGPTDDSIFKSEEFLTATEFKRTATIVLPLSHLKRLAFFTVAVSALTRLGVEAVEKIRNRVRTHVTPAPDAPPAPVLGGLVEDENGVEEVGEEAGLITRNVVEDLEAAGALEETTARYALDWEARNPGAVLKLMQKVNGFFGNKMSLKTLAKVKFVGSALFAAGAIALDVVDFIQVQNMIDHGSWTAASLSLKKAHITIEAHVQELLRFRASVDPSWADDYFMLKVDDRFVCPVGRKLKVIDSDVVNPALQFQGLRPGKEWRHHLTGKRIIMETHPSGYELEDLDTWAEDFGRWPSEHEPEYIDLGPRREAYLLEDEKQTEKDKNNLDYLRSLYPGEQWKDCFPEEGDPDGGPLFRAVDRSSEGKNIVEIQLTSNGRSVGSSALDSVVSVIAGSNYGGNRFKAVVGADIEQLYRPSYGLLKNDGGYYLIIDGLSNFVLTRTRPGLEQAFALTSARCIQHRYNYKCIAPKGSVDLVAGNKPQDNCQWRWGFPMEDPKQFLAGSLWSYQSSSGANTAIEFKDNYLVAFGADTKFGDGSGYPDKRAVVSGFDGNASWSGLIYEEPRALEQVDTGLYLNTTGNGIIRSDRPMAWTFESFLDAPAKDFASVTVRIPGADKKSIALKFTDKNYFTTTDPWDESEVQGVRITMETMGDLGPKRWPKFGVTSAKPNHAA